MLGHPEIIVIAAVVLILFGSTAIPRFFRALGKARREFDKGQAEALESTSAEAIDQTKSDQQAEKK